MLCLKIIVFQCNTLKTNN